MTVSFDLAFTATVQAAELLALGVLFPTLLGLHARRRAAGPRVVALAHPPQPTLDPPHLRIGDDGRRPTVEPGRADPAHARTGSAALAPPAVLESRQ